MKALSPLIGAVLLIMITLTLASILSNWSMLFSREHVSEIESETESRLQCQRAELYIKNVTYLCAGDCDWSDPFCDGTPFTCNAHNYSQTNCTIAQCTWNPGNCAGTADPCNAHNYSQTNCTIAECSWNAETCSGSPFICSTHDDSQTNCTIAGCTWDTEGCEGSPNPCSAYDDEQLNCSLAGCSFTPEYCGGFPANCDIYGDQSSCELGGCTWGGGGTLKLGTWTDTLGTFDWTPTRNVWTDVPFNNEVSADAIYTINVDDDEVNLGEAGHYLVMYAIAEDGSYNGRAGWEIRLTVNNVAKPGSFSSCYNRNNDDESFCEGGAIIDVSQNDDIGVELNYRTDRGDQTLTSSANECSFQIVKIDDTFSYLSLGKTANLAFSNSVWVDIPWEVETEEGSSFTHVANSEIITLEDAGHYLVSVGVTVESGSSSGRVAPEIHVLLDGAETPYLRSKAYCRGSNDHRECHPRTIGIIDVSAGTDLSVEIKDGQVETAITSNVREADTGIQIVKLPDTANYYMAYTNTERNPSTSATPTLFDVIDVEDEEDAAYSGSTTGEVTIQSSYEGNYLMTFAGTGDRSGTSGTRSIPYLEWYKDGSSMNLGGIGYYVRGSQGSYDVFDQGDSASIIIENSGTSIFALYGYERGDGGADQDRFEANEYGITMVRLDDLVSGGGSCSGSPSGCGNYTVTNCTNVSCTWFANDCSGTPDGCGNFTQTNCTDFGCTWDPANCGGSAFNCITHTNQTNCTTSGCDWEEAYCDGSPGVCSNHATQIDCTTSGCDWEDNYCSGTPTECTNHNESSGNCTTSGCAWNPPQPGDCTSSENHTIVTNIKNMGAVPLSIDEMIILNTTDYKYNHNFTESQIAPGDIGTIITNISERKFNNSIQQVTIACKNCPKTARDIYPGEDVTYVAC